MHGGAADHRGFPGGQGHHLHGLGVEGNGRDLRGHNQQLGDVLGIGGEADEEQILRMRENCKNKGFDIGKVKDGRGHIPGEDVLLGLRFFHQDDHRVAVHGGDADHRGFPWGQGHNLHSLGVEGDGEIMEDVSICLGMFLVLETSLVKDGS